MSKADPDRVPTYEESQLAAAHPTPLAQQLITARTQHIDNLLARTGLLPRLAARVAAGWHLATFVLIPADSGAALSAADLAAAELAPSNGKASAPSDEQALELPSAVASVQDLLPRDDPAAVLQLVCADPPGGFWRQTGAAPALGRVLRSRLRADGHAVEEELQLLQRVRDEAHRFAITHHRIRRDRAMTASVLDDLPGVGPARKRALLAHFGSPDAILTASREELAAVPGVPGKLAREMFSQLHRSTV